VPCSAKSTTFFSGTVYVIGASFSVYAPAVIPAKAVHCASGGFVQALAFDFYRVLDTITVTVADPAERHEVSVSFRRIFAFVESCLTSSALGASLSRQIHSEPPVIIGIPHFLRDER
jgi:hypothetical protein